MEGSRGLVDDHAHGWRLAARTTAGVTRIPVAFDDGVRLLLVDAGDGDWWALPAACARCGAPLSDDDPKAAPAPRLRCDGCGAAHGPGSDAGPTVPTLIVDDEIYVLVVTEEVDRAQ